MNLRIPLAFVAMALALPALAQSSSSTSTATSGGATVQQGTAANANANTSVTGKTGDTITSTGAAVDSPADRALLSQIVAELAAAPAIQGSAISVQVVGGRVTLSGEARDTNQAENAKEIAQVVAGKANVTSNVTTGRQYFSP